MLAQALPQTPLASESAPPPAMGRVEAALHSQSFGPELAASVSLLAVEGVQQAELQLNPADMGPVAVQIVVDGAQAQVSFHAVQADTRQALEQSLPDLAAALQGQGLTLAGGGVFQQAPRDNPGESDSRDRGDGGSRVAGISGERSTGAAGAPVTVTRRANGLLDTFA
jgi:flagellar hook-length control protein FliK